MNDISLMVELKAATDSTSTKIPTEALSLMAQFWRILTTDNIIIQSMQW